MRGTTVAASRRGRPRRRGDAPLSLGWAPVSARCKRFSGPLGIEPKPCAGPIPKPHPSEPVRVRVDPVASDAEFLGQVARIDQPNAWPRRRDELGEVLGQRLHLLDVERQEPPAAGRKQLELARNDHRQMGRRPCSDWPVSLSLHDSL